MSTGRTGGASFTACLSSASRGAPVRDDGSPAPCVARGRRYVGGTRFRRLVVTSTTREWTEADSNPERLRTGPSSLPREDDCPTAREPDLDGPNHTSLSGA